MFVYEPEVILLPVHPLGGYAALLLDGERNAAQDSAGQELRYLMPLLLMGTWHDIVPLMIICSSNLNISLDRYCTNTFATHLELLYSPPRLYDIPYLENTGNEDNC
jgi:hypothetical protein